MALLSKQDILDSKDSKTITVSVPEWDGDVKLITLTAFERDKYESSLIGANNGHNLINARAKLASICMVDEDNKKVFTEKDILKLGQKSSKALDRIYWAAIKLNKTSPDAMEEEAKN